MAGPNGSNILFYDSLSVPAADGSANVRTIHWDTATNIFPRINNEALVTKGSIAQSQVDTTKYRDPIASTFPTTPASNQIWLTLNYYLIGNGATFQTSPLIEAIHYFMLLGTRAVSTNFIAVGFKWKSNTTYNLIFSRVDLNGSGVPTWPGGADDMEIGPYTHNSSDRLQILFDTSAKRVDQVWRNNTQVDAGAWTPSGTISVSEKVTWWNYDRVVGPKGYGYSLYNWNIIGNDILTSAANSRPDALDGANTWNVRILVPTKDVAPHGATRWAVSDALKNRYQCVDDFNDLEGTTPTRVPNNDSLTNGGTTTKEEQLGFGPWPGGTVKEVRFGYISNAGTAPSGANNVWACAQGAKALGTWQTGSAHPHWWPTTNPRGSAWGTTYRGQLDMDVVQFGWKVGASATCTMVYLEVVDVSGAAQAVNQENLQAFEKVTGITAVGTAVSSSLSTGNITVSSNDANRSLVLYVVFASTVTLGAVTWNGASMTQVVSADASLNAPERMAFYILDNPTPGTGAFTVNWTGGGANVGIVAAYLRNADASYSAGTLREFSGGADHNPAYNAASSARDYLFVGGIMGNGTQTPTLSGGTMIGQATFAGEDGNQCLVMGYLPGNTASVFSNCYNTLRDTTLSMGLNKELSNQGLRPNVVEACQYYSRHGALV